MRTALPNRRACESIAFTHRMQPWTVSFSRFPDGRVAEVFLAAPRAGTDQAHAAIDAAVTASIAFQCGADVETIRAALIRDAEGLAAGPLAAALDAIVGGSDG